MLFTKKDRKEIAKLNGLSFTQEAALESRCSGRSTKIAFETFAECYRQKNKWVAVVDHNIRRESERYLFELMKDMAYKLNFDFEWKQDRNGFFVMLLEK